jgi:hypothetical protein
VKESEEGPETIKSQPHVMKLPDEEETGRKIFKEIMIENLPNLMENNTHTQETINSK